jgi:predicted membrane chloride channel (bestrophin family)
MTAVTFASPERPRRPQGSALLRRLNKAAGMALGFLIILLGLLIAPLPGPLGLPIVALGLILVLRTSTGAKRLFIKAHRRWPRVLSPVRRLLRRNSPFVSIFWQMVLRMEKFVTRGHGLMAGWRRSLRRRRTA